MIIFKDRCTGKEMFSDSIKGFKEVEDGFMYEIEVKMIMKTDQQIDESVFGGNKSAEGGDEDEGVDAPGCQQVLDIIDGYRLECMDDFIDTTKKLQTYLKKYLGTAVKYLEEHDTPKEEVDSLKETLKKNIKKFTDVFANSDGNCSVYIGEGACYDDYNCAPSLLAWDEDGKGGKMYFMKCLCEEEKV